MTIYMKIEGRIKNHNGMLAILQNPKRAGHLLERDHALRMKLKTLPRLELDLCVILTETWQRVDSNETITDYLHRAP